MAYHTAKIDLQHSIVWCIYGIFIDAYSYLVGNIMNET